MCLVRDVSSLIWCGRTWKNVHKYFVASHIFCISLWKGGCETVITVDIDCQFKEVQSLFCQAYIESENMIASKWVLCCCGDELKRFHLFMTNLLCVGMWLLWSFHLLFVNILYYLSHRFYSTQDICKPKILFLGIWCTCADHLCFVDNIYYYCY